MELSLEEMVALARSLRAWPPPALVELFTCSMDARGGIEVS
jgi:hypothetical protein